MTKYIILWNEKDHKFYLISEQFQDKEFTTILTTRYNMCNWDMAPKELNTCMFNIMKEIESMQWESFTINCKG